MKVLVVVTHPRTDSLTFKAAKRFTEGLKDGGHETEVLELYQTGFNPVLHEKDEPNWKANKHEYSSEVEIEVERMNKHNGFAFIFPLWWWNMPAMLKGYIDRVWNYGIAYGPKKLHHQNVLWLGLAGGSYERFEKRKYNQMMEHYFNVGLADFCGIPNSKFELLYETKNIEPESMEKWLNQAYDLGLNYGEK